MSEPAITDLERRDAETLTPQQELMVKLEGPKFQQALVALLPDNVTPDRFRRVFGTALMTNPDLVEAEPTTIMQSLLHIAAMGLLPDGREAAIVVRRNNKKGIKEAQAQPMIGGVRKRFAEHGWTLRTQHVYENDDFEYVLVPNEEVTRHVRVRPGGERGELVHAYAIGTHRDGRRQVVVIDRERAMAAKAKAQYTGPGSPWAVHEPQMWEKTAGHRLAKQVGLSDDDRLVRMFAPPADPADSAVALYGDRARAALTPAPDNVDPDTGEISSPDPLQGTSAQQAAEAEPKDPSPPAASAVPEPDDDAEPSLEDDEQTTFTDLIPDGEAQEAHALAEQAEMARVPAGAYFGKTIAEVAAVGGRGESWLAWALKPERSWNREGDKDAGFGADAATYVRLRLPDVHEAHQAWLADHQGS